MFRGTSSKCLFCWITYTNGSGKMEVSLDYIKRSVNSGTTQRLHQGPKTYKYYELEFCITDSIIQWDR